MVESPCFIVLGTTEFTLSCAAGILDSGCQVQALISTPSARRPDNSTDIAGFATERKIDYHETLDINEPESRSFLRDRHPDFVFSSWPWLIGQETLSIPRRMTIGSHPAPLPANRGRHPLHWLLALGYPHLALSFFRMDEGVDSGDILLQLSVPVQPEDTIGGLTGRMNTLARDGIRQLCERLVRDPDFTGIPQDHSQANTWRKRTPHDIILDPRMSVDAVIRTVRSFAPPYPCAKLLFRSHALAIEAAWPSSLDFSADWVARQEHGRICAIEERCLHLKVDGGIVSLLLKEAIPESLMKVRYIYPPSRYFLEHGSSLRQELGL